MMSETWRGRVEEELFRARRVERELLQRTRLHLAKLRINRQHCGSVGCRAIDTDAVLEELEAVGFSVIHEAFSSDFATRLRDATLAVDDLTYEGVKHKGGRLCDLEHLHPAWQALIAEKQIVSVLARVLGADLRLSGSVAVTQRPGVGTIGWHQDYPFTDPRLIPEWGTTQSVQSVALVVVFMLDAFTEANGTLVIPGSHRLGVGPENRNQPRPDSVPLLGPPGSIAILDPRLWHSGQKNDTDRARVGGFVHYRRWWLRPWRKLRPARSRAPWGELLRQLTSERIDVISDGLRPQLLHSHLAEMTWLFENAPPGIRARMGVIVEQVRTQGQRVKDFLSS